MGCQRRGNLPSSEKVATIVSCTGSFRPQPTSHSILRCVSVWVGSSVIPQDAEWRGKTCGICISYTELKYSQLDKEALAIVFGVKKYHSYLYGRQFVLKTDHKPLIHIFKETRAIPTLASGRIQHWALIMSAYSYTIQYKPGKENSNADAMSRLPAPGSNTETSRSRALNGVP